MSAWEEVVFWPNRRLYWVGLAATPVVFLSGISGLGSNGAYPVISVVWSGALAALFVSRLKKRGPAVILRHDGIVDGATLSGGGFVSWSDLEAPEVFSRAGVVMLRIRFRVPQRGLARFNRPWGLAIPKLAVLRFDDLAAEATRLYAQCTNSP